MPSGQVVVREQETTRGEAIRKHGSMQDPAVHLSRRALLETDDQRKYHPSEGRPQHLEVYQAGTASRRGSDLG